MFHLGPEHLAGCQLQRKKRVDVLDGATRNRWKTNIVLGGGRQKNLQIATHTLHRYPAIDLTAPGWPFVKRKIYCRAASSKT